MLPDLTKLCPSLDSVLTEVLKGSGNESGVLEGVALTYLYLFGNFLDALDNFFLPGGPLD